MLLLLEHPPVYTRGRRSTPEELPMGAEWYEAQGIEVRDTDRGGLVTYHGPGQLVAYPIVCLGPYGDDVHEYVRGLEQVMIGALGRARRRGADHRGPDRGLDRGRPHRGPTGEASSCDRPGGAKIGSIGVHVSRGVTTHGLAVNVNNDLQPFEWIVPCGIEGVRDDLAERASWAPSRTSTPSPRPSPTRFGEVFERDPAASAADLAGRSARSADDR